MQALINEKKNEYFSKDLLLLRSFLDKKANAPPDTIRKNTEISSISSANNTVIETSPNKSQQTSIKVKELIQKTKQKLKLNKKTRENRFESKMKAFTKLDSYIDSSNLFKNMNRINDIKENSKSENMLSFLSNMQILENLEEEEEDEPIFMVNGKPTTKFPRLRVKVELLEKARGIIKTLNKSKIRSRYSFQFNDFPKEQWNLPEIRRIGENSLEIKKPLVRNTIIKSLGALNNPDYKEDKIIENIALKTKEKEGLKIEFEKTEKNKKKEKIEEKELEESKKEQITHFPQLKKSIQTYEHLSPPRNHSDLIKQQKKTAIPKVSVGAAICRYLMEESKKYSDQFEEKFLDDLKSGKFLGKFEDDNEEKIDRRVENELIRFNHFLQHNKNVSNKLKNDLQNGVYEEAFKSQAEKIGNLLKRAARNIFNQKEKLLEEALQKKNQKLKRKVNEISDFMLRQNLSSLSRISKAKYSHISSKYINNTSVITNPLDKNNIESKIDLNEKSKFLSSLEIEKSNLKFESENTHPKTATATQHKSILKNRILSPIFLTDEKSLMNVNVSNIEKEEGSNLLSPIMKRRSVKLIKKKKSSLYEAMNKEFDDFLAVEQNKKNALKNQNKKENREIRHKFERLLNDLDESKVYQNIEKMEFSKDITEIQKNWDEIDDKTKGIDALRLLARDYKSKI